MTIRKTDPVERVDMLLAQAERFARRNLTGEAVARAKQAIALCELERERDPRLTDALEQRELVAESLIGRLGKARTVRDAYGHARVHADDASHPEAWA